jgi:hypothetical protein
MAQELTMTAQVASSQLGNEDSRKDHKASLLDGVDPVDMIVEGSRSRDCIEPMRVSSTETVAEVPSPQIASLGDIDVAADAATDVADEAAGALLEMLGGMLDGL